MSPEFLHWIVWMLVPAPYLVLVYQMGLEFGLSRERCRRRKIGFGDG